MNSRSNEFLGFTHAAMQCIYFAAYDLNKAIQCLEAKKFVDAVFFIQTGEKEISYAEQWIRSLPQ